jgi:hypothetical protein
LTFRHCHREFHHVNLVPLGGIFHLDLRMCSVFAVLAKRRKMEVAAALGELKPQGRNTKLKQFPWGSHF